MQAAEAEESDSDIEIVEVPLKSFQIYRVLTVDARVRPQEEASCI
jgi:hypothetical protein